MRSPYLLTAFAAAVMSLAFAAAPWSAGWGQEEVVPAAPADADPAVEELTSGPLHEAFASPTEPDPQPTAVVPRKPPEDIQEEPPAFRPEGAVVWINGYWDWDVQLEDYVWVSGMWRAPPPGQRFVPGYWTEVDGGWQRVRGFWVSADIEEIEYRDPPPETLEVGPTTPAPAENYFYIPGCWNYYESGYRWRPGYWSPYQANWIWTPARWAWTPAGCVFIPGYWDHRLAYRGTCFAPIYFRHRHFVGYHDFYYRPRVVLNPASFLIHLWVGPRYNCYYFGNYYDRYDRWGFQPWWQHHHHHHRHLHDPLFAWYDVHYRRHGINFHSRMRDWHDFYHDHDDWRPARTWAEQVNIVRTRGDVEINNVQNITNIQNIIIGSDLRDVVNRTDSDVRFVRLDDRDITRVREQSSARLAINEERHRVEREVRQALRESGADRVETLKPADGEVNRTDRVASRAAEIREKVKLKLPRADAQVSLDARTGADARVGRDRARAGADATVEADAATRIERDVRERIDSKVGVDGRAAADVDAAVRGEGDVTDADRGAGTAGGLEARIRDRIEGRTRGAADIESRVRIGDDPIRVGPPTVGEGATNEATVDRSTDRHTGRAGVGAGTSSGVEVDAIPRNLDDSSSRDAARRRDESIRRGDTQRGNEAKARSSGDGTAPRRADRTMAPGVDRPPGLDRAAIDRDRVIRERAGAGVTPQDNVSPRSVEEPRANRGSRIEVTPRSSRSIESDIRSSVERQLNSGSRESRGESRRSETPRIEVPRESRSSTPRIEVPRESRNMTPRIEVPRSSGNSDRSVLNANRGDGGGSRSFSASSSRGNSGNSGASMRSLSSGGNRGGSEARSSGGSNRGGGDRGGGNKSRGRDRDDD